MAKIIKFHSEMDKQIFLWLRDNQNLPAMERIEHIKEVIRTQNLDAEILLHLAASSFNTFYEFSKTPDRLNDLHAATIKKLPEISDYLQKRKSGKLGAAAKHKKTDAAKEEIKKIWAAGKYSSRDVCAEQECAALNISFSTARRALRNTPEPTRNT